MKVTAISSLTAVAVLALATPSLALVVVDTYEDLTEGNQGIPFSHQGVTYHDLNNVSGVFPDGTTFDPSTDDECIVENAGLFYNDFPGYGSPINSLTFGIAFVPGDNLTIGPLSTVTLDLADPARAASLHLGYYENGPWGGIVYHLDGVLGGQVVASDSFVIADGGGRDNPTWDELSISTDQSFDSLHLYATFGSEYSLPRAMIDDLTIDYLEPSPTLEMSWGAVKRTYR